LLYLKIALPVLLLAGALLAQPLYAHGFGERYVLPMPLSYFAMGGAAAVVLSFIVVGTVVKGENRSFRYPRFNLFRFRWLEALLTGPALWPIKLVSVFLLLLVLATGFLGNPRPIDNFTPTFVWVIWWVGLGFFVALLGNLWALVNPWRIIFGWAEALYGRVRPDQELSLGYEYPQHWGIWPAAALFFAFAWVETSYAEGGADPRNLAWLVVIYSLITFGGMLAFGKHQWLRRGEIFSVVFGILSRFSITELRVPDAEACRQCSSGDCRNEDGDCIDCYECFQYADERQFNLRPPAVGLDNPGTVNASVVALVMFLLALVTFDGFSATQEWLYVQSYFITMFPTLTNPVLNGVTIANTLGLIGFPLAFVGIYWIFSNLIHQVVGRRPPETSIIMGAFVFSLIPIALAYHYAHFLAYLLIQGQLIIALISDPFGWGWDLFGTADYLINVQVISPRFVWFFSVGAIVLGHMIAVYLAHIRALRVYQDSSLAMRSQIPMLGLMVVYTVASLWVVTRPITQ
jgi:hypothetical protein